MECWTQMRKDKFNLYALRSDQFWIGMSTFLKGKHFFVTSYINIFTVGFLSILDFLKWISNGRSTVWIFTHDFDRGFTVQATKMFFWIETQEDDHEKLISEPVCALWTVQYYDITIFPCFKSSESYGGQNGIKNKNYCSVIFSFIWNL